MMTRKLVKVFCWLVISQLVLSGGLVLFNEVNSARPNLDSEKVKGPLDVVINEVFYNPPGSYEYNDEWIEVKNIGSTEVNMSGWNLTVKNTEYNIYAPPTNGGQGNITLQPGEFAVLTPKAEQFLTNYPNHTGNVFDCDYFRLSNSDDVNLDLTDSSQQYDNITYNGDTWPGSDGYSMELMYPDQENNDSANWAESLVYNGTPGEENSMYNGGPSDYPPTIHETTRTPSVVHNETNATIISRVTDDYQVVSVNLYYRLDGGTFTSVEMVDDGSNGDEVAGDGNYTGIIPKQSTNTSVDYYVEAQDNATQNTTDPTNAPNDLYSYTVVSAQTAQVTLNEFLPEQDSDWNDDGSVDQGDEFIEIYNNESQEVNISGWYLDDEEGGSSPYQLPDGTIIQPDGFLVFYNNETSIGLNNDEDEVRLMRDDQLLVDSKSYTSPSPDVSYVRIPDGYGEWNTTSSPSPGAPNSGANTPPDAPTNPSPVDGTSNVSTSATLSVDVSDPDGDLLDVTFYNASDNSSIGTDSGVSSGSSASVTWSGLASNHTYQWYAVANDSQAENTSSTWSFTTGEAVSEKIHITEVFYDPPTDPDEYGEYIELFNPNSYEVNISEWIVGDDTTYNFTISPSTVLPGYTYFCIANDNTTFHDNYSMEPDESGLPFGLNNGDDSVTLYASDGSEVDYVAYNRGDWSGLSASEGEVIERKDRFTDTDTVDDWHVTTPDPKTTANNTYPPAPNKPPNEPTNPSPSNGSTGINTDVTLSVDVSDPNGDSMDVTFYNASGPSVIGTATGVDNASTVLVNWTGLAHNHTYHWYAVANDTQAENVSATWSFTTAKEEINRTYNITINEYLPDPNTDWNNDGVADSGDEFIELYNNEDVEANISGWYLDDIANGGTGPYQIPSGTSIPAGGFLEFYNNETDVSLNNGDDQVRLLHENMTDADNTSYSSVTTGESYIRMPDGSGDWTTTSTPTPGAANSIPNDAPTQPSNPSPSDGATGISTSPMLSVTVSDPDGDSMDVTFYNASDNSTIGSESGVPDGNTADFEWTGLSLAHTYQWYVVVDDGVNTTQSSTWSFTTIETMNNPPDEPSNPSPADGATGLSTDIELSVNISDPDGDSMDVTFYNASDDSVIDTATGVADGSTASVSWSGLAKNHTYQWYAVANDSQAENVSATWSFTTAKEEINRTYNITINEYLPDPNTDWNNDGVADSGDEFIELYNNEDVEANISGWYLDDIANGGTGPYQIPSGTTIPAGGFLEFYKTETNVGLNNGEDDVRLLYENQTVADNVSYSSSSAGESYIRMPDGSGDWTTTSTPTPGAPNSIPNDAPAQPSNPSPSDGATGISTSPTLSVTVSDPDGDSMDVTFYNASDNSTIGSVSGVPDGNTAEFEWTGLALAHTYQWYVVVDDGVNTTQSSTWSFTTIETMNNPPDEPSNPSPADGATGLSTDIELSVNISDPDGDLMNVTFFNASDDGQIKNKPDMDNGTVSAIWSGLALNTSYSWYVQVDDGVETVTSPTWSFTTQKEGDTSPPKAVIVVGSTTVGLEDMVTFDGTDSVDDTGITNYTWTVESGTYKGSTLDHSFSSLGDHEVTLNVTDAAGNYDTATVTITVEDRTGPTADIVVDSTQVQVNKEMTFDGTDSTDNVGIENYSWDFDDGSTAYGSTVSHTFSATGEYTVSQTAYDAAGNSGTDEVIITVASEEDTQPPTASISADKTDITAGDTVNFDGTGSSDNVGIDTYTWSIEDDTLDGDKVEYTFYEPGNITVSLTVRDRAGNEDTAQININVAQLPPEGDKDGDGMPNGWERENDLDPFDPADAEMDADDDDYTNLEEYNKDTDPQDEFSHPEEKDEGGFPLMIMIPIVVVGVIVAVVGVYFLRKKEEPKEPVEEKSAQFDEMEDIPAEEEPGEEEMGMNNIDWDELEEEGSGEQQEDTEEALDEVFEEDER